MKVFVFLFFIIISFNSKAQLDYGFLGRKNLISLSANGAVSLLYNMNSRAVYYDNGFDPYVNDKPWFRVNYKFEYQRLLSDYFSVGVELGYNNQRMLSSGVDAYVDFGFNSTYIYSVISPNYDSYTILPTLSYYRYGSIGFTGFSYQFGIGPSFHKLNIGKTRFASNVFNSLDELVIDPDALFIGMSAFLQVNYRLPINSGIFIDIGFRANGDFIFGDSYSYFNLSYDGFQMPRISEDNQRFFLRQKGLYDIFSLKLGLAYQF